MIYWPTLSFAQVQDILDTQAFLLKTQNAPNARARLLTIERPDNHASLMISYPTKNWPLDFHSPLSVKKFGHRLYVIVTTLLKMPQMPIKHILLRTPTEDDQNQIAAEIAMQCIPMEAGVAEVKWRLNVVEQLKAMITFSLQRITRLRQSLLQKSFTRKLKS